MTLEQAQKICEPCLKITGMKEKTTQAKMTFTLGDYVPYDVDLKSCKSGMNFVDGMRVYIVIFEKKVKFISDHQEFDFLGQKQIGNSILDQDILGSNPVNPQQMSTQQ